MATELVSPVILNVAIAATGTEYSVTLPANVRQYTIRHRNTLLSAQLRFAYTSGLVATSVSPFFTLGGQEQYPSPEKVGTSGQTIYFAGTSTSSVVEILYWI
jgi:hypothetical protein